jgi:hypothetical protein
VLYIHPEFRGRQSHEPEFEGSGYGNAIGPPSGAVVEQVQLTRQRRRVGGACLLGQLGEQTAHPRGVRVGGLVHPSRIQVMFECTPSKRGDPVRCGGVVALPVRTGGRLGRGSGCSGGRLWC